MRESPVSFPWVRGVWEQSIDRRTSSGQPHPRVERMKVRSREVWVLSTALIVARPAPGTLYPVSVTSDAASNFRERARFEAARYGSDPWVFVRELLQNSRDAGACKMWITVTQSEGRDRIECRDDGAGMSFEHARRYLFTLYASSKRGGAKKIPLREDLQRIEQELEKQRRVRPALGLDPERPRGDRNPYSPAKERTRG